MEAHRPRAHQGSTALESSSRRNPHAAELQRRDPRTGSRGARVKRGAAADGLEASFQTDEDTIQPPVVMAAYLCEHTKMYNFQWVTFILCEV